MATALAREVSPFVQRAMPLLRSDPFVVSGEVISIERRQGTTFVTLVDTEHSGAFLEARFAEAPALALGDHVALTGSLVPTKPDITTIEIVFSAERVLAAHGPSRRQRERHQLLQQYARVRRPRLPRRPRRVALVTSERSRAVADFRRALAGPGERELVRVDVFSVDLTDADSIARGLLRARDTRPDLVVLTRGGGGSSDLFAFREPALLACVASVSRSLPVVVAVGHAEDAFELDHVATATATTPTAAGFLVRRLILDPPRRIWPILLLAILVALLVAWWSARGRPLRGHSTPPRHSEVASCRSRDLHANPEIAIFGSQLLGITDPADLQRSRLTMHYHASIVDSLCGRDEA